eukprot:CAMPEP_0201564552 /NCGR_PEP_ID=MMETSP0190_2-20130828/2950_1 /ASSEMBLY_ACC=CAM_ASM_000263 /TAXON_ID=37353 /ORGANISM="Rosalina sp." /LENGTH=357 /DNA_ID=CAMNT_0047980887 /DNA_START=44 /DNA_END=1117 /DNA_ORIENTATION=+
MATDYAVGDRVEIKGAKPKPAQILVIVEGNSSAKTKHFGEGKFYGVRTAEDGQGTCDGRYKNQDPYFFKCPKNCGKFVQAKDIIKKIDGDFDFTKETTEIEAAKSKDDEKYDKEKAKTSALMAIFKKYDDGGKGDGNYGGNKAEEKDQALSQDEWIAFAKAELGIDDDKEAIVLFRTADVSGNGSLSLAEFDAFFSGGGRQAIDKIKQYGALKKAFKDADKDGSLSLEVDEFVKMANKAMKLNEQEAKILFITVDANDNGSISYEEFTAYVDDIGGSENFDVYRKMIDEFKAADKDNSGSLDGAEFVKLLKDKFKYNKFKAQRVFVSIDTDKSESISLSEFEAFIKKIGGVRALEKK